MIVVFSPPFVGCQYLLLYDYKILVSFVVVDPCIFDHIVCPLFLVLLLILFLYSLYLCIVRCIVRCIVVRLSDCILLCRSALSYWWDQSPCIGGSKEVPSIASLQSSLQHSLGGIEILES